jgi:hypothetical protein
MVLRDSTTGQFEGYNISNNTIASSSNLGTIGRNFQVAGFGDFNADGTSDMMLRNTTSGQFELYDIVNNQITSAFNIGIVGLDFAVAGFADFNQDGTTDMMLRSATGGQFEVYDIVNNQITSAFKGLDWSGGGGGGAGAPPARAVGEDSNDQLVQAMAGFGGAGAAETLNAAAFGSDTPQQSFLTTPPA